MKECDCIPWTMKAKPHYQEAVAFDSSQSGVPMYFGVKIDFCPFCGKLLQEPPLKPE